MSFPFWRRWLIGVCCAVILYSLALILFPAAMHTLFNTLFYSARDTDGLFSEDGEAYLKLILGVLGAVIIGWMVTLLALVLTLFRPGERPVWNTLTISIIIWFVIDSGFSLYIGVPAHALFNTGFLMLFMLPLGATYKHFYQE